MTDIAIHTIHGMVKYCIPHRYYTSAKYIRILTAPDEASESFGASQSKIVCSVRPDRYSLTDAFSGLVTTPGHWEGH